VIFSKTAGAPALRFLGMSTNVSSPVSASASASASPSPVPEGQRLFPYLVVRDAARAIAFYGAAFGAEESYRMEMNDGKTGNKIGHAEIAFAGVTVWLADEFPEMGFAAPADGAGGGVSVVVYVADVDGLAARAVAAGARLAHPVRDEFYGDRVAVLLDPFGHRWMFHTRRELVTPDEIRRGRAARV
jgi:PhnB protein